RRETRDRLFRAKELHRQDEVEQKVLDQILSKIPVFDLPLDLIAGEVKDAERRREIELRLHENKSEEEAKRIVATETDDLKKDVQRSLRVFFVVDEIARREKVNVSDADIDARVARIAAASGKWPAEVRKYLEEKKVLPQLRHEILNEKTRALLREHA